MWLTSDLERLNKNFLCKKNSIGKIFRIKKQVKGAQWLSGRVLDLRPKGRRFEPHWRHCVVSLSKNINPSLILVQPRKTRPFITERLLMGRKESNQTNKKQVQSVNPGFKRPLKKKTKNWFSRQIFA